tara:strand:+ start:271 stop:543 length:273 start_codon:yes stop_codon:yes gene_type:complete
MKNKQHLSIETVCSYMNKSESYDYYQTIDGKLISHSVKVNYDINGNITQMLFLPSGGTPETILLPIDSDISVEIKASQLIADHINKQNGI